MSEHLIPEGLSFSIPANNQKVIEIYNKLRNNQIVVNKAYQRKLVWKIAHKLKFIDTILRNYPFPEIYLAPGNLDQEKLILVDEIVDGQQRLTTIKDYIQGEDVFSLEKLAIKKFSELTTTEKTAFLNYEISVRYLKGVSEEQVKEIFQRINKTDYALNTAERLNAQWGGSEFVCFAKQIIDQEFLSEDAVFILDERIKNKLNVFFAGGEDDESVFSSNDVTRMLAYQYIMTLVATFLDGYFNRNEKLQSFIEMYNDSFPSAAEVASRIAAVVDFLQDIEIKKYSRWYKKANLFTLMVELDRISLEHINRDKFLGFLIDLDHRANEGERDDQNGLPGLTSDEEQYIGYAREAVNQKIAREFRGRFIHQLIEKCKK